MQVDEDLESIRGLLLERNAESEKQVGPGVV